MTDRSIALTLRRLTAAEGYLELDLPDYALEELDRIEDAGDYSGVADWLRGEAHKEKRDYTAAIASLQRAVRDIPAPHNRAAMESLQTCFRSTGQNDLADVFEQLVQAQADDDSAEDADAPVLRVEITLVRRSGDRVAESDPEAVDPEAE